MEGDQVVLTCTSVSNPPSRQKIYFTSTISGSSTMVDTSFTDYVITSIKANEQGTYSCTPYNSLGNGPQRSLVLTVNGKNKGSYEFNKSFS